MGFQLAAPSAGGALLDSLSSLESTQQLLQDMSLQQKRAHLWITILLDIPYPLAYGGLFAGLCLRHGDRYGLWLASPALLVIPIDLVENGIQILALLGIEALLVAKEFLTPAKFLLFGIAALLALACLLKSIATKALNKLKG